MRISYGKNLEHYFDIDDDKSIKRLELLNVRPKGIKLGDGNPDWQFLVERGENAKRRR